MFTDKDLSNKINLTIILQQIILCISFVINLMIY